MTARRSFRAIPASQGARHRVGRRRGASALAVLGGAAAVGATLGLGSVTLDAKERAAVVAAARPLAIKAGLVRARAPRVGDHWYGCDAARAAGTAPIYASEPGYRPEMDGDGDGIACEPVPPGR